MKRDWASLQQDQYSPISEFPIQKDIVKESETEAIEEIDINSFDLAFSEWNTKQAIVQKRTKLMGMRKYLKRKENLTKTLTTLHPDG